MDTKSNTNAEINKPALSIIIPVYNAEQFLERAINSVLASTLDNIEILVVDDASEGNCRDIVASYSSQVRYIRHNKNKGLFAARYTGITEARGDYIVHLDADDWVVNDVYSKAYQRGKALNADVVYFNLLQCDDTGRTWNDKKNVIHPFELKTGRDIIDEMYLTNGYWALHVCWNKLIKREVALQLLDDFSGDEYVNMFEDVLWSTSLFLKLYQHGRVTMVPDIGIMYYRHDQSLTLGISHELMAQKIDNTLAVYATIKDLLEKYQLFPLYQSFYERKMHNALSFPLRNVQEGFSQAFPEHFSKAKLTLKALYKDSESDCYFNYPCARIKEKIEDSKPQGVFLYGLDTLAQRVFKDMSDMNIETLGFVVSHNEQQHRRMNNLPVYSIKDIQNQSEFKHIVVGSISSFYEIKNTIHERRPDATVIGVFD